MLNHISTIWEYRDFLTIHKSHLDVSQLKLLKSKYRPALSKLRKLDISLASNILFPLYSLTGRPAINPAVLVRSFVLMNHLKYSSIKLWCDDLANDSLLQYLIGSFNPPNSSSHYDFIIRLTGFDPHLSDLAPQSFITKKKFKNKPAKGEKLINFTKDDTSSICDKYRNGAEFDRDHLLFTMQSLFNAIVVIPLIDHNKRRKSIESKTGESINSDGIPVCSCGHTMTYDGYDYTRYRKKYRCPLKAGLIDSCPFAQTCSTSDYGRVVYVKDKDNEPRFKGPVSYGSPKWKSLYKDRTCTERINNAVLNTYGLHKMHLRNGAKNGFFSIIAGINLHLDAWLKAEV